MNTVTEEQVGLVTRLSRMSEIRTLLSNEETEWRAIVYLQNSLLEAECAKYINIICDNIGKNMGNATIDDRIKAYIQVKLKQ